MLFTEYDRRRSGFSSAPLDMEYDSNKNKNREIASQPNL